MTLERSMRLARSSQLVGGEVDGEMVLISIQDGKYFGLDPIGTEIWRRLEEPKRFDVLTAELQDFFDGEPEVIEREAANFVEQLLGANLLTTA
jgi:hypothetical protein